MFYFIKYFFYRVRLNLRKVKSYFMLNKFNVAILDNVTIKYRPKRCTIGKHVKFYENCIIEISPSADLEIGDNCVFSYGVLLSSYSKITIGNDVMIGEYTSLRDTTHQYDSRDQPMMNGKDITQAITIGNNVWIGRGSMIFPGTEIEDGVVVAANSVVKGHLKSNHIYGGNPAKMIKPRL